MTLPLGGLVGGALCREAMLGNAAVRESARRERVGRGAVCRARRQDSNSPIRAVQQGVWLREGRGRAPRMRTRQSAGRSSLGGARLAIGSPSSRIHVSVAVTGPRDLVCNIGKGTSKTRIRQAEMTGKSQRAGLSAADAGSVLLLAQSFAHLLFRWIMRTFHFCSPCGLGDQWHEMELH